MLLKSLFTCISFSLTLAFILPGFPAVSAQNPGSIMIAGGGAESAGGWSDSSYHWVVEQAENKKIAVISYSSNQSEWIPDYFKSFGAVMANNFHIPDRFTADQQWVYDSLIRYDGVFLKGGDQFIYYDRYRNTKTQEALQYIYDKGGVLSGTSAGNVILSPVIFTAGMISVDPGQALLNSYSAQMTLEDDFLSTLKGRYIYDSHFAQYGRFGRLPAFMASWYKNEGEKVTGLGVDDHTSMSIGKDNIARVYGTGAVSLFYPSQGDLPYDTTLNMLRTGTMKMTQLLHGCSIDLSTGVSSGLENYIIPPVTGETGRYTVLLTGTDYPSEDAYDYFVNSAGSAEDEILIVSGSNTGRVDDIKSQLQNRGAVTVHSIQALFVNKDDSSVKERIEEAGKFLFVSNDYTEFMNFLKATKNGRLLYDRLKSTGSISLFAGDNARLAGKTVVEKYMDSGSASYNGALELREGTGLLETTVIMPNTFLHSEYYENAVTGLPYAMVADSLRYGMYITGNSFVAYLTGEDNTSFFQCISGSFPLILLENEGTKTSLANQGPYRNSRNIAGFDSMNLRFLAPNDRLVTGKDIPIHNPEFQEPIVRIYPNPAKDFLAVDLLPGDYLLRLSDVYGRSCFSQKINGSSEIAVGDFPDGAYFVSLVDIPGQKILYRQKILIRRP